jgi:flavocytochrome c
MTQVIVVGGGLAGLSAAHTVLEHGGRVVVLDKNAFLGGNSTKATSGINGALTNTQIKLGIKDSVDAFYEDTAKSARKLLRPEIAKVLTYESGPAVEWLQAKFALDLSLVSRLGGHSFPRTHRGKERFPGMTITYALMEKIEDIAQKQPQVARVITKARVTKLITEGGAVVGVEYEKDGKVAIEHGVVILATGGYGADFSDDSILKKVRPDLLYLPTTNGDHCTGDGVKLALDVGANPADLEWVQVHPTGLVDPNESDAKLKFLAAEALRGVGGLLLDRDGDRFCNELGHRDYVTGEMWKRNKAPYRLIMNSAGSKEIEWHCKHYVGRGLMKKFSSGAELAKEMNVPVSKLDSIFKRYSEEAKTDKDEYGKKFFHNLPFEVKDEFHVAIVTPVIHYCMGGIEIDAAAAVVGKQGAIQGLYATGEVCGGVHGENRLGGNSLLDCVVFGRVSGVSAARQLLQQLSSNSQNGAAVRRIATVSRQLTTPSITVTVEPNGQRVNFEVNFGDGGAQVHSSAPATSSSSSSSSSHSASSSLTTAPSSTSPTTANTPNAAPGGAAPAGKKEYTKDEVSKHNTEKDCWVIVNGQVLDVTHFLKDHPGGKKAILLFAGKDATEEFNMLHKPDVVEKYAPESVIGTLKK